MLATGDRRIIIDLLKAEVVVTKAEEALDLATRGRVVASNRLAAAEGELLEAQDHVNEAFPGLSSDLLIGNISL